MSCRWVQVVSLAASTAIYRPIAALPVYRWFSSALVAA